MFRTNQKLLFLLAGLFLATGLLTLTACTKKPPVVSDNGNNSNNTNNVSNNGNNTQSQNNNSNGVNDNGNNSQQDNNQQKPEKDPEEVVQEFYEWYISGKSNNINFRGLNEPEAKNYIADGFNDNFICAQDLPNCGVEVELIKISNQEAEVIAHNYFSPNCQTTEDFTDNKVTISLKLVEGEWKVVKAKCPNRK